MPNLEGEEIEMDDIDGLKFTDEDDFELEEVE